VKYALPTGIMPEQLQPYTGEALSVAPLNWSHAAYIIAFMEYVARRRELGRRRE
jgi:GH15 family glucan-1,4-alpha-glucosidase